MVTADLVLATALAYVVFLFAVAFFGDLRARKGRLGWLQSPLVYTLSISIYCTSWTFYGAVGSAARSGLEFATIYIGPTLVFVGWWVLLRKLVRIGKIHRITSIADMISSRYGKSASLAALVTVIAVVGGDAVHRAATEGGDQQLPGHQRLGPRHLARLSAGAARFPDRLLGRRRHGAVHDPLRHAQHRRQRAPPRRRRGDRGRGRGQAVRAAGRRAAGGRRPRHFDLRAVRARARPTCCTPTRSSGRAGSP